MESRTIIVLGEREADFLFAERLRALNDYWERVGCEQRLFGRGRDGVKARLCVLGRNRDNSISAEIRITETGSRKRYVRRVRTHPSLAYTSTSTKRLRLVS